MWSMCEDSLVCSGNGAGIQSRAPFRVGASGSPQEVALKLRRFWRVGRQQEPVIKTGDRDCEPAPQTATCCGQMARGEWEGMRTGIGTHFPSMGGCGEAECREMANA